MAWNRQAQNMGADVRDENADMYEYKHPLTGEVIRFSRNRETGNVSNMEAMDESTAKLPIPGTLPNPNIDWGPGAAYYQGMAEGGMQNTNAMMGDWYGQSQDPYGNMAFENQQLSDQEAHTRGYDQAGALQLAREAAMGNAPSAAAYQMQAGLNAAGSQQAAQAGGARGAAGLALAQQNAAGNVANMQQNVFTDAARLRAQEMAEARGMYGGLAGQMRQQDQSRLGMGNQMAQFNSNLGLQRQLGFGNLALGANDQSRSWAGMGMNAWDNQQKNQLTEFQLRSMQQQQAAELKAASEAAARDQRDNKNRANEGKLATGLTFTGNMIAPGFGGAVANQGFNAARKY